MQPVHVTAEWKQIPLTLSWVVITRTDTSLAILTQLTAMCTDVPIESGTGVMRSLKTAPGIALGLA